MPISISRLRHWFAGVAIFVCLAVFGTYFYARHRVTNALKQVPGKIGLEIQQSAQGFTISKSEQGRTLFRLQAKKAIQFKQGLRAELHDVTITLYGRDSSRFDQVYGQDFEYDQQSGNVTSNGEVSIDLQANPQGILHPDQTPPKELKNPLHLKTTGLIFNQKTGDAWTLAEVDFRVPQASGSALGAKYAASEGILTLESQVRIAVNGATPSTILAEQATLQKAPREIVLRRARAESPTQRGQADEVTLFLQDDNALARTVATGNVQIEARAQNKVQSGSQVSAQKLEVKMKPANLVESAVLSGNVHLKTEREQAAEAWAGRTEISFAGHNVITKIHAAEQVKLLQHQPSRDSTPTLAAENAARMGHPPIKNDRRPAPHEQQEQKDAPDVEVTAPAMDFVVAKGNRLARAETIGAPQISLLPNGKQRETRVTADKFTAKFDSQGQLQQVHGEANARVVSSAPPHIGAPEPERISTSDSIDAYFRPARGIEGLVQNGHFTYTSGSQKAFADRARYTPADQILTLTGSPRIIDVGMATTARTVRLNRSTGDALAQGDVKTTYSDLKPEPSGALLASSDPIHVTAESMTAHNSPAIATYKGNARLWQNANVIEAPTIQFQKEARTAEAESVSGLKVSTVLVGTDKNGKATPVRITSSRLSYRDSERKAHFEGGVTAQGSDLTITSNQMDVFLASSDGTPTAAPSQNLSKLEKIVASGSVLITEPNRHATGDKLTYTASDDKFVLTGGSPSIFDAEHGKITGVSLTLFRHDDRVVVDGDSSSPAVTQTRVVR
jgi:lipopolysaccharide export system protein LptA